MQKIQASKKLIILTVATLLMAGAAGALVYWRLNSEQQATDTNGNDISYSPPTEQEKQVGDKKKEEIVKEQEEAEDRPEVTQAEVIITDANQYGNEVEVRAFVSNIIKSGSCAVTLKQGSSTITRTATATPDASTTQCANVIIPRSEFPQGGDWTVTVSYKSEGISGEATTSLQLQ